MECTFDCPARRVLKHPCSVGRKAQETSCSFPCPGVAPRQIFIRRFRELPRRTRLATPRQGNSRLRRWLPLRLPVVIVTDYPCPSASSHQLGAIVSHADAFSVVPLKRIFLGAAPPSQVTLWAAATRSFHDPTFAPDSRQHHFGGLGLLTIGMLPMLLYI